MAKLNSTTVVRDPAGQRVTLFEGQELPEWAVDQVGEHLLASGTSSASTPGTASQPAADDSLPVTRGWLRGEGGKVLARHMIDALGEIEGADDADPGTPPPPPPDVDELPPTSGKGSGIEAWQNYAQHKGIAYPQGASRDEIMAAVQAARPDQQ
jgi:hypothetical protein